MSPQRTLRHGLRRDLQATLSIAADEIHVWRANLDEQSDDAVAAMSRLLSIDETDRARQFYFERDRRRFVIARGVLRTLLARYLACAPAEIAFRYGQNGKPALSLANACCAARPGQPLYFNVAHSDALALFAFTVTGEVGVDVEKIREMPDWESIAEFGFSPQELARLRGCEPASRREEFFRAWTRQEAILKALGTGFGVVNESAAACARGYHVHSLNVGPGYAAALAARGGARIATQIRSWSEGERKDTRSPAALSQARRSLTGHKTLSTFTSRITHP